MASTTTTTKRTARKAAPAKATAKAPAKGKAPAKAAPAKTAKPKLGDRAYRYGPSIAEDSREKLVRQAVKAGATTMPAVRRWLRDNGHAASRSWLQPIVDKVTGTTPAKATAKAAAPAKATATTGTRKGRKETAQRAAVKARTEQRAQARRAKAS